MTALLLDFPLKRRKRASCRRNPRHLMFLRDEGYGFGSGAPRRRPFAYRLGRGLGRALVSLLAYMTKRPRPRPKPVRPRWPCWVKVFLVLSLVVIFIKPLLFAPVLLAAAARPTHLAANGQSVAFNEPFAVGDSLMMFPGDSSLNADAAELINCRCLVSYE